MKAGPELRSNRGRRQHAPSAAGGQSMASRSMLPGKPEIEADQLREAVENMHGGKATLVQSVPVKETFMGGIIWEGGREKMTSAPKPRKSLGFVVCTDATGNEKSRIDYFNEEHAQALERDCTRRGGYPNRSQVQ